MSKRMMILRLPLCITEKIEEMRRQKIWTEEDTSSLSRKITVKHVKPWPNEADDVANHPSQLSMHMDAGGYGVRAMPRTVCQQTLNGDHKGMCSPQIIILDVDFDYFHTVNSKQLFARFVWVCTFSYSKKEAIIVWR